jgi:hypothetical protein
MANITNSGGTNIADVDANGRLKVQPPTDGTNAGAMFLVGKPDINSSATTGSITGSSQGLLGVANVVIDFDKNFVNSAICTSDMTATRTTTDTVVTNFLTLNSASSVASGVYSNNRTYRHFKVEKGSDRVFGIRAKFDVAPVVNTMVELGAFIASTNSAPTAGVFFRYGTDGALRGVSISNSGTENTTSTISISAPTDFHDYVIVVGRSGVTFFIDELPVASLPTPADGTAPVASESLPLAWRFQNTAAVSMAQKVYIARYVSATMGGSKMPDVRYLQAIQGDVGIQHVVGIGTGGMTANWANSAVPATASLSNTAAGYSTLGGNFLFVGLAAAETDYALFAYQVPVASITNMGRALIVRGITIDGYVSAAAGTPTVATVLHWGFAIGCTGASLATAEGATSKLPRRGFLGIQSALIGAVAGTELRRISQTFDQPMAVNPGEYFHIILRIPTGAATTYPTIRGGVYVDAGWE